MIDLTVRLLNRDFTERQAAVAATLLPTSYSFAAIGGPERASIAVDGSATALWEAVEWLRCPLEIRDARGTPVWWGYVASVDVAVGAITVGVSLDDMATRVAVAYSGLASGSMAAGNRATTGWEESAATILEYGKKDLMVTAVSLDDIAAVGYAQRLANDLGVPVPTVNLGGSGGSSAMLTCRGWWDTLGWNYYSNGGLADTGLSSQIQAIITAAIAANSFIVGLDIETVSTLTTTQYRDGDRTGLAEILSLMQMGNGSGKRMLATVKSDRRIRLYTEPTAAVGSDYYVDAAGQMYDQYEVLLANHTCPVAVWCRLKDVLPESAGLSRLANPSPFFVERNQYDVGSGRLTPEPRGRQSPWQVGEGQIG